MTVQGAAAQVFGVGDVSVVKVVDVIEPMSPKVLYVGKSREDFDPHLDWLQPHFLDEARSMLLSIHSLIIRTGHHTVLVDTRLGNHKQDAGFPAERPAGHLPEDLAAAGCSPESIDYVFCTHMHIDHTGWNTRLQDGRWVPRSPTPATCSTRPSGTGSRTTPAPTSRRCCARTCCPSSRPTRCSGSTGNGRSTTWPACCPPPATPPGTAACGWPAPGGGR
ncbi:MAG: MBL fold metallo-hydrolase [Acidimicrobiales bacterium]